jgi:hypothetical protein
MIAALLRIRARKMESIDPESSLDGKEILYKKDPRNVDVEFGQRAGATSFGGVG